MSISCSWRGRESCAGDNVDASDFPAGKRKSIANRMKINRRGPILFIMFCSSPLFLIRIGKSGSNDAHIGTITHKLLYTSVTKPLNPTLSLVQKVSIIASNGTLTNRLMHFGNTFIHAPLHPRTLVLSYPRTPASFASPHVRTPVPPYPRSSASRVISAKLMFFASVKV